MPDMDYEEEATPSEWSLGFDQQFEYYFGPNAQPFAEHAGTALTAQSTFKAQAAI